MKGRAVFLDQFLVERDLDGAARSRHTLGSLQSAIGHGAALGAALRRHPAPRGVAWQARQSLASSSCSFASGPEETIRRGYTPARMHPPRQRCAAQDSSHSILEDRLCHIGLIDAPARQGVVVNKPLVVSHSSIRGDDRSGQPADEHPVIGTRNRIEQCIDVGQMVSAKP